MILETYCGYINSDELVKLSSSGGLATAMAENIISNGGLVYGVSYSSDFKGSEYIRVEKYESISRLKGSKYIKSYLKKEILESVSRDLLDNKKVLFIGLPCDINTLKEYLYKHEINITQLLTVDLICQGPTYPDVARTYIEYLENKYKSKITNFSVRYKNPYWKPPYLFAQFENGKIFIKPFYNTAYGTAFLNMPQNPCFNCKFKNENYKSDITIGDFWGSKEGEPGYNIYGSSVAFVHSKNGDSFINSLDNFVLFKTNSEAAIRSNPRYLSSVEQTDRKIKFKKDFEKGGLFYAASKNLSLKEKIARKIPKKLFSLIKKAKKVF